MAQIESRVMDLVEIRSAGAKGEGLFARRLIRKGSTIIILPTPLFLAVDSAHLRSTCYGCLQTFGQSQSEAVDEHHDDTGWKKLPPLKACFGCFEVRFCSWSCHKRAWEQYHQYECDTFDNVNQKLPTADERVVIRALLLRARGVLDDDRWQRLLTLHQNGRHQLNDERAEHLAAVKRIQERSKTFEESNTIRTLLAIVNANAFDLDDDKCGKIGLHLHPELSKANHSCSPNARFLEHDRGDPEAWDCFPARHDQENKAFGILRALKDIKRGQEITISYLSAAEICLAYKQRREKLQAAWYFHCRCDKCVYEENKAKPKTRSRSTVQLKLTDMFRIGKGAAQKLSKTRTKNIVTS